MKTPIGLYENFYVRTAPISVIIIICSLPIDVCVAGGIFSFHLPAIRFQHQLTSDLYKRKLGPGLHQTVSVSRSDNSSRLGEQFKIEKQKPLTFNTMDDNECCICLDIMKKEVETDCSHRFCVKCLFIWVFECVNDDDDRDINCPMCRTKLRLQFLKWKPAVEVN